MAADTPELLGVVSEALARHSVFGDSDYIRERLIGCYSQRLEIIGEHIPAALRFKDAIEAARGDALHRTLGDTVVRCAIHHAHAQLAQGSTTGLPLDTCAEILSGAERHLASNASSSPLSGGGALQRLGPRPHLGWIWNEGHPDDVFGRSFRFLVQQNYGGDLCTPSEDEQSALAAGERLLHSVLPELSASALSHAQVISVFPSEGRWKGTASSSQYRISGAIFLSRKMLYGPWVAAEHLLHESLHHKLYDFRHAHTFLNRTYADADSPRVRSVWNPENFADSNLWDSHRTFAAFHVYVHLGLFTRLAEMKSEELSGQFGPISGMLDSRRALDRAWYLGEKLTGDCWEQLGFAGQTFARWLLDVLSEIDADPPPKGSHVHLALDLYLKEAKKVENMSLDPATGVNHLSAELSRLAKQETDAAQDLLCKIRPDAPGAPLAPTETHQPISLPQVRRALCGAFLGALPHRCGLPEPHGRAVNSEIGAFVRTASDDLFCVLENISPAVGAARSRATRLRFRQSCTDQVGRLLATLAGPVRPGARILEIGTGVGLGTAWMVAGVAGRGDVQIVSIEADPSLHSETISWDWPDNVDFVLGDAAERLPSLGQFDLIFADASPFKFQHVELIMKAMRPNGLLIMDDLADPPSAPKVTEKSILKNALLRNPALQATELSWESGIILAVFKGPRFALTRQLDA